MSRNSRASTGGSVADIAPPLVRALVKQRNHFFGESLQFVEVERRTHREDDPLRSVLGIATDRVGNLGRGAAEGGRPHQLCRDAVAIEQGGLEPLAFGQDQWKRGADRRWGGRMFPEVRAALTELV